MKNNIIGHTKSGKPIFVDEPMRMHTGFTRQDHMDAVNLYSLKLEEAKKNNNEDEIDDAKTGLYLHNREAFLLGEKEKSNQSKEDAENHML